jgi:hypothetical protein
MRPMVVKVGPEIEQLVFEICRTPKQNVIQILLWLANGYAGPILAVIAPRK